MTGLWTYDIHGDLDEKRGLEIVTKGRKGV